MRRLALMAIEYVFVLLSGETIKRQWYSRGFTAGREDKNENYHAELHRLNKQVAFLQEKLEAKRKVVKQRVPQWTRRQVIREAGYTCQYCGKCEADMTVDHIVPVADGGTNDKANLVCCCLDCNKKKGYMPLPEFLKTLNPSPPKG